MRIVIWVPGWNHMHGGVRALYKLKDELRARGIDAWTSLDEYPADATAIYPEIVPSNFLNAPRAIFWLLNRAAYPEGTETWAWETGMGNHPLLTVDIIEPYWRERGKQRKGIAWWAGKGTPQPHLIPEGAEEIHRGNHPDREELAEYVSGLDYLISFDPFTSLNIEAAVSGTPVLIHQCSPDWNREDFQRHAWIRHGIAWDHAELDQARDEVNKAAEEYDRKRRHFALRIEAFIESISKTPIP